MKLTEKEKNYLEELLNSDFFGDYQGDGDNAIFLAYICDITNEEKGIIGSLIKKGIINVAKDEDYDDNWKKIKIGDVFLNCTTRNRQKFIDSNLNNKGINCIVWELKTNEIDDSTLIHY